MSLRQGWARQGAAWHIVPEQLANSLPPQMWPQLGLDEVSPHTVAAMIRQVGPSQIDCRVLTAEERDALLGEIRADDIDVLRELSIHEDLQGNLLPVTPWMNGNPLGSPKPVTLSQPLVTVSDESVPKLRTTASSASRGGHAPSLSSSARGGGQRPKTA